MKTNRLDNRAPTILLAVLLGLGILFAVLGAAQTALAEGTDFDCTPAGMNVGDCNALVDLYDSTGGSGWNTADNWLSGSPCSETDGWYGVSCQGGRVTGISLPLNSLAGALPASIGDMSELSQLNFFSNTITGTLPASIYTLDQLTLLHLGHNQLEGPIPTSLNQMDALQFLYLNQNQFEGTIPTELTDLTSLVLLYLHGNMLEGAVPAALCTMPNLVNMDLGYNKLEVQTESSDSCLDTIDGTWRSTQTIPPEPTFGPTSAVATEAATDGAGVTITWDLIPFTAGGGHYEVLMSTTPGSYGVEIAGRTGSKLENSIFIDGLTPGQAYYFVVRTRSYANEFNPNVLVSDFSEEISNTPVALDLTRFGAGEIDAAAVLPDAALALGLLIALTAATLLRRRSI